MSDPFTVFLKWDGIVFDAIDEKPNPARLARWCNHRDAPTLPRPPVPKKKKKGAATLTHLWDRGLTLSTQRAEVMLISVSKPFAPMQSYCNIEISIKNIEKAGCLVLQIHDRDSNLVYAERLTQTRIWGMAALGAGATTDEPPLAWKADEAAVDRTGMKFATPLGAPYTATVWISDAPCSVPDDSYGIELKCTQEKKPKKGRQVTKNSVKCVPVMAPEVVAAISQAQVQYHSVGLSVMSWADVYKSTTKLTALTRPTTTGKPQITWVQYKLNELGFPAGPLDGTESDELKRAIRRFRQASRVLRQRLWQPSPDYEYVAEKPGGMDELGKIDGPLLDELDRNTPRRVQLDDPHGVDDPNAKAKVYVDQDRYYLTPGEMDVEPRLAAHTIKNTAEKDWIGRPLVPVKATVYLRNGAGKAVAPAALGPITIKWSWKDGAIEPDEGGAGKLPTVVKDAPSQTSVYVTKAIARVHDVVKSEFKNARAAVGGLITGTDADRRVVFRELAELPITALGSGQATTPVQVAFGEHDPLLGGAAIYFAPSVIGGDNYQLAAEIALPSTVPALQAQALTKALEHKDVKSGWMTVWRRMRLAAHISWPSLTGAKWEETYRTLHPSAPDLDVPGVWALARREYADAFMEVVGPARFETTKTFPADFATKFKDAIDLVKPKGQIPAEERYWVDVVAKGFLDTAYFPSDPPVKGLSKTSADAINAAVATLLDPEVNGPAPGDDPPRLKALKKWVADWSTLDIGLTDPKTDALSNLPKDAYLVDAAAYFNNNPPWVEVKLGGKKRYLKPLSVVVGSTALAPWAPDPVFVQDNQAKSLTSVDAINLRVKTLMDPELGARHATDEVIDMPRTQGLWSAVTRMIGGWSSGVDYALGYGDAPTLPNKNDAFLKAAAKHFKTELERLTSENTTPEKKVFRYKKVALPAPYVPSIVLSESIAASLRDGVATAVNNVIKKTQVLLMGELEKAVFADTDPGIVILDFKPHTEVMLASAAGPPENFLAKIFAMANGSGLVILDQAHLEAYRWYHLFTHELGHCAFLKHWKNAGGFDAMDHDWADENCQMSYSTEKDPAGRTVGVGDHYNLGKYQPHFCGKCNLKLRGWDLRAKTAETDPKGDPIDLLPATSDLSKTVEIIDYVEPIPAVAKIAKAKIPSPNMLDECCTEMVAQLLGETTGDAAKRWIARVNAPGLIRLIANPKVVMRGARATIEWENVPLETVPEGATWPTTDGVARVFEPGDNQAWIDNLEYMMTTGGLTAATNSKVELNYHFPYADFTDLIHETWHLIQKMSGDQPLYEGVTDLLADLLGRRLATKAATQKDRFAYQYNPSYAESTLSVIDEWLPAMGIRALANLYVKDEDTLTPILKVVPDSKKKLSDQLMKSQSWAARASFLVARPADPIRNDLRELRSDIEECIVNAPADVRAELRGAIHGFLDFLIAAQATLTGPQKLEVAKYTGTQKYYEIARLIRRVRKQYSFTRSLRAAATFKHDAELAGKTIRDEDKFVDYVEKELERFNEPKIDPKNDLDDASPPNDSYVR